jgi:hypothetical protein
MASAIHICFGCRIPKHRFPDAASFSKAVLILASVIALHTKYAHTEYASMHFASETSKYAKLNEVEPTNIPYAATKAKLSLSKRSLLAAFRIPR